MKNALLLLLSVVLSAPCWAQAEAKKKTDFRAALMTAVDQAEKDQTLTAAHARKIRFWTRFPGIAKKVQTYCAEEAVTVGKAPAVDIPPTATAAQREAAIYQASVSWDWSSLIAFLKELLPLIQQLIEWLTTLFGWVSPGVTSVAGWLAPWVLAA